MTTADDEIAQYDQAIAKDQEEARALRADGDEANASAVDFLIMQKQARRDELAHARDTAKKADTPEGRAAAASAQNTVDEVADLVRPDPPAATAPKPAPANDDRDDFTAREEDLAAKGITDVGDILVGGATGATAPPVPPEPAPAPALPTLGELGDQKDAGQGCLRKLGIPVAAIILVLAVAVGAILIAKGGDDTKTSTEGGAAAGGGTADQAADTPGSLAGHWVLVDGLRDMNGRDEMLLDHSADSPWSLGSRSASFDVAEDGTVTGGSYHAEHTTTTDPCTFHVTLDASTASGAIHAGAFSNVRWEGTQRRDISSSGDASACRDSGGAPQPVELWFSVVGEDLVACYQPLQGTVCSQPAGGSAARFHR